MINEYLDPETGEILELHPAMVAPKARTNRLNEDGSEKLCDIPLVSPLSRQPSLKDRINSMIRSGELAQLIREGQNALNDDDDDYEGFDRNYLDEEVPTFAELQSLSRQNPTEPPQAPEKAPQASNEPTATPPPPTTEDEA